MRDDPDDELPDFVIPTAEEIDQRRAPATGRSGSHARQSGFVSSIRRVFGIRPGVGEARTETKAGRRPVLTTPDTPMPEPDESQPLTPPPVLERPERRLASSMDELARPGVSALNPPVEQPSKPSRAEDQGARRAPKGLRITRVSPRDEGSHRPGGTSR